MLSYCSYLIGIIVIFISLQLPHCYYCNYLIVGDVIVILQKGRLPWVTTTVLGVVGAEELHCDGREPAGHVLSQRSSARMEVVFSFLFLSMVTVGFPWMTLACYGAEKYLWYLQRVHFAWLASCPAELIFGFLINHQGPGGDQKPILWRRKPPPPLTQHPHADHSTIDSSQK